MGINELLLSAENILVIANRDDLITFAEKYAELILAGKDKTPEKEETERPISQPEAVEFLGKSRQTLVAWRKKGIIKGYRLGGRLYFMRSELVAAFEKLG
jgi:Helix-turn-helix domain